MMLVNHKFKKSNRIREDEDGDGDDDMTMVLMMMDHNGFHVARVKARFGPWTRRPTNNQCGAGWRLT